MNVVGSHDHTSVMNSEILSHGSKVDKTMFQKSEVIHKTDGKFRVMIVKPKRGNEMNARFKFNSLERADTQKEDLGPRDLIIQRKIRDDEKAGNLQNEPDLSHILAKNRKNIKKRS